MVGKKNSKEDVNVSSAESDVTSGDEERVVERYVVERVVDKKVVNGKIQYIIKWEKWEPVENLDCPEAIDEFEKNRQKENGRRVKNDHAKDAVDKLPGNKEQKKRDSNNSDVSEKKKPSIKRVTVLPTIDKNRNGTDKSNDKIGAKNGKSKAYVNDDNEKNDTKNDDELSEEMKNVGLVNGCEPETILDATDLYGPLEFLIRWKNSNRATLVAARIASVKYPQTVIAFYESRISWSLRGDDDEKDDTENDDEVSEETENVGFDYGYEPETILDATCSNGPLEFLIHWKNSDRATLVPARIANVKCPQTVIAFYESRLIWNHG